MSRTLDSISTLGGRINEKRPPLITSTATTIFELVRNAFTIICISIFIPLPGACLKTKMSPLKHGNVFTFAIQIGKCVLNWFRVCNHRNETHTHTQHARHSMKTLLMPWCLGTVRTLIWRLAAYTVVHVVAQFLYVSMCILCTYTACFLQHTNWIKLYRRKNQKFIIALDSTDTAPADGVVVAAAVDANDAFQLGNWFAATRSSRGTPRRF